MGTRGLRPGGQPPHEKPRRQPCHLELRRSVPADRPAKGGSSLHLHHGRGGESKDETMVEGASLTTYAWTYYGALESEITGSQTTAYSYNGQDQLAGVVEPDGKRSTYTFDGDGLRRTAWESRAASATTMVWDGSDYLLLSEPTGNRVVLTLDSEIVSCGSKDLLTDPLGSLVKEISTGASLGSLVELYPYGTRASALTKISIPFVYIAAYGYYTDSAERDYVRARELYKKLGRWMQTDPLWPVEPAFGYAFAQPIRLVDPSGLAPNVLFDACLGLLCAAAHTGNLVADIISIGGYAGLEGTIKEILKEFAKEYGKDKIEDLIKEKCGVTDTAECLKDARRKPPRTIVGRLIRFLCSKFFNPNEMVCRDCYTLYGGNDEKCNACCDKNFSNPIYRQKCKDYCTGPG
ncbi:MAG: hypothetical protein DCC46_10495 [Armatimonadetes bacterium]|nr:MAG: hypothetical protein DCC46_10495 [Armatimonadota bacterium]